jgi:hypothetical protein
MAGIDKCYLDNYEDYLQLKDWMTGRRFTTPRGCVVKLEDYLYQWDKESFEKTEEDGSPVSLPVFNTPVFVDNYLYHNCPLKFIQDWLSDRYLVAGFRKGNAVDIMGELGIPKYEPCKKVKVLKKGLGNNPPSGRGWWIEIDDISDEMQLCGFRWYRYNEDLDFWVLPIEEDVWTISSAYLKCSVKTIIRKIIKKWKLPTGVKVKIYSMYNNDTWILKTK